VPDYIGDVTTMKHCKGQKDPAAEAIIARYDRLKGDRGTWDTLWQDIADYIQPRKSQITAQKTPDVVGYTDSLYNLTAVRANQILASGQMDYLFSGRWFSYDAPEELTGGGEGDQLADEAQAYFQRCTEIAMKELARSNWPLKVHEMLLDRGGFGTAPLLLEEGTKSTLAFHNFDVGTYVIEEDHEGEVDTLIREFKLTARQAVQKFGRDALGPIVGKAADDEKKRDTKFTFLHSIHPRDAKDRKPGKIDGENKPIASCYVSRDDRCMVKESGYDEQAVAVSRFLKWGSDPYGYSPSIEALPTVRQVNFIEKNWDALTEIKAFPRVLVPDTMEGDLDMRAGGATTFDPNAPNAMPKEWGTQGDDRTLEKRVEMKDKAIREAFHVDLFQMLQQIERQMTAYEVAQRLAEKVTAFSPTFYRLQTEVTEPILMRVFAILFRAGKFPQPPQSVMVEKEPGVVAMAMPQVTLTSKLAMAIKAAENNAFTQMVAILAPLAQMDPTILDNYDLDKAARGIGRNLAVPTSWERSTDEVDELRASRAQAAQQREAVEQAQGAAKAAKDASAASPEVRRAVMSA